MIAERFTWSLLLGAARPAGPSDIARLIGREPCCDEDMGGSHYHCARCSQVTGVMGCGYCIGVVREPAP